MTVPFFQVVIFSGVSKDVASQTTVPFFMVVIFLYFDTNTNYGTYNRKKLLPEKRYSRLAGYFFQRVQITTRINYDRKKRYSRLANG
jgi:hypothetical protein